MSTRLIIILLTILCINMAHGVDSTSAPTATRSAYQIKGIVLDENDEPLPGATVKIVGTTYAAATDSKGQFSLRVDDNKTFRIQVYFMGYQTIVIPVSPEESATIRLEPSTNELDEVVVTGSFIERPIKDVPVLTRVIAQRDIQALNPQSIEQLLQYELPGLQIGYNSMSQLPSISYQGMGGDYMLFLIDGERVSGEGSDHNVDFTRFNIDDIERIEVVKGAQSTIYGSNALGGVINIITKTADRPVTATLNGRYAGTDGQKYTGAIGFKKDRFTSYTSLTWRKRDTYTVGDSEGKTTVTENGDGTTTVDVASPTSTTVWGYNIWDFTQKLGYNISEKWSVDVKGTHYWNQRDIRTGRLYQEYYQDLTLGGKLKYIPAVGQQLTIGYQYDNFKKDHHFFRVDSTLLNYRNVIQTPRIDYTGRFGNNNISVGLEGNLEYLKHYMFVDSTHYTNTAIALYAQDELVTDQGLDVIAGVRADWHEKYHWHLTPKISALYRAWEGMMTLRVGYAQGFRSPSLKELYMEYDMGGLGWFMIYGNHNLKPESSNQYSASTEFNKNGWNMSVAFAHNRFRNKIEYLLLSDGTSNMQYVNAEKAKTTSVEAILRYKFRWGLTLTGSYVYTDDYSGIDGRNTSLVRPHSAIFNAMFSKKIRKITYTAAINGQWASAFDTYSRSSEVDASGNYSWEKTRYDGRTLMSANIGATFPRGIYVNIGADNILNYKDKSADAALQVPQKGMSLVATIGLNLSDMFKW